MQISCLLASALMITVATGCKDKQNLPATAATSGTENTMVTEAPVATPAPVRPAPEPTVPRDAKDLQADSIFFTMERTPCFGTCPAYKLTIFADGSALYEGRRFAPREGRYVGKVDPATMEALYEMATTRGFFGMEDIYDSNITDLPSVIIRVHAHGQDKQVRARHGAPQAFKTFSQEAEQYLADVEWTRTGDLR